LLAIVVAVLGACSTLPTTTTTLDQAHADYFAAQANPNVARYAPMELKKAGDEMMLADAASNRRDDSAKVDQLAYLAKQQIAVAQEVTKEKVAAAEQESAAAAREQIRLAQRTQEADAAKRAADAARMAAQVAQGEAADARRDTDEAQRASLEAQAKAAQLEAQLADLSAKQTARGLVITLGDVLFATDVAHLTPAGMRTVQKLADVLQQNPRRTVLVEGYTDSTGTAQHNQELSERRAGAVRTALQSMGIAGDRVATQGYGPANPVASNATAADRQLNRRVEIVLSDDNGKVAQR
jgi:outer membrane protein OmpA-like peptidoglycan-associated protein